MVDGDFGWSESRVEQSLQGRSSLSRLDNKDCLFGGPILRPTKDMYINIWATAKTLAILNMYWTDIGFWRFVEIVQNTR